MSNPINNTGISSAPQDPSSPEGGFSIFNTVERKSAPENLKERLSGPASEAGATIYIVDRDDKSQIKYATNKFILTGLSFTFREKAQLIETFGASSVSFFDDTVKVYNFTGSAVDYPTEDGAYKGMQQSSMIQMYRSVLRGTKLVKENSIAALRVLNHTIFGYPLNLQVQYSATSDKLASFTMSWVITKHKLTTVDGITESQLKRAYTAGRTTADTEEKKRIQESIDNFFSAYRENMFLNVDTGGRGNPIYRLILDEYIPIFTESGGGSVRRLRYDIFSKVGENANDLENDIKSNIQSLVNYFRTSGLAPFLERISDEELDTVENSIENIFDNDIALSNVSVFLNTVRAIHTKLFMAKLFL